MKTAGKSLNIERTAHSYGDYPLVRTPADLRIGDVWLVNCGGWRRARRGRPRTCTRWGHIRIVSDVQRVTENGVQKVEFQTAESTGGSRSPRAGQVGRSWRTNNLTTFNPVVRQPAGERVRNGEFHRPF